MWESILLYMFKDPFSPDHTQKLDDEWLRYFKKNCKNPKMVSGILLCLSIYSFLYKWNQAAGEKSEPGKAGDSPSWGEETKDDKDDNYDKSLIDANLGCFCDFLVPDT